MPLHVLFHHSESTRECDTRRMRKAIRTISTDYGWSDGEISVALVDDVAIREINKQHLAHDYATDVISFDLTDGDELLEGEIIASVETADRNASEHKWGGDDELLLYVIHGMLHIVGLGDKTSIQVKEMRSAESHYLAMFRTRREF